MRMRCQPTRVQRCIGPYVCSPGGPARAGLVGVLGAQDVAPDANLHEGVALPLLPHVGQVLAPEHRQRQLRHGAHGGEGPSSGGGGQPWK